MQGAMFCFYSGNSEKMQMNESKMLLLRFGIFSLETFCLRMAHFAPQYSIKSKTHHLQLIYTKCAYEFYDK